MKTKFNAASLVLALAVAGCAQMAPKGSDARLEQINRQHSVALERCGTMKGNTRDVCRAEADAHKKVARAQAKVAEDDTPKNRLELAEAQADGEFKVAKARCDGQIGTAKDNCEKSAARRHESALAEAEMQSQISTATGSGGATGSSASGAPSRRQAD